MRISFPGRWTFSDELQLEFERSRRYGHQFALVRISCRRGVQEEWRLRDLACAMRSLVRRVDRVWIEGTRVYMLLPECDRSMGEGMLSRIHESLAGFLSDERVALSSAVFPDEGMTTGALLVTLNGRSRRETSRQAPTVPPGVPDSPAA